MKKAKWFFTILVAVGFSLPVPASAQFWGTFFSPYSSYYGSYDGYGYGYGYVRETGIKFHMDLIPKKDRETAKKGIVVVDGNEISIVNRYDGYWNGILRLPPGMHEISVVLPDEREFTTLTSIMAGETRHIYVRGFSLPVKPIESAVESAERAHPQSQQLQQSRAALPRKSTPDAVYPPGTEACGFWYWCYQ